MKLCGKLRTGKRLECEGWALLELQLMRYRSGRCSDLPPETPSKPPVTLRWS